MFVPGARDLSFLGPIVSQIFQNVGKNLQR